MAKQEITGASPLDLENMKEEYYTSPMYENGDIPFDVAYCLTKIPYQPDHYDGPDRFCKRRAKKRKEEEAERYDEYNIDAFCVSCQTHGGDLEAVGHEQKDKLDNPLTAAITHGAHAKDEHLKMDFTDEEQALYDDIMGNWPEIYNWPPESEDPARYRILRRVAVNEVRALREEDHIDDEGEVYQEPEYDERGEIVGYTDTENPLSREYRLLMSEVTNQMKELGLTPKEQQKMDKMASEESKNDAMVDVAKDALDSDDQEYDPDQFEEGDG